MRFCNNCNALLREDENFCHKCGAKIQADDDYNDGFFNETDKGTIDFSPLIEQEEEVQDNNIYSHSQHFEKDDNTNDDAVNKNGGENSETGTDANDEEAQPDAFESSPFAPPVIQNESVAQENPFIQPEQPKFRKVCPNCNQPLNNGQSVCPYCGYDIARYNDDYDSPINGEYQPYIPQDSYSPKQKKGNKSKTAIIVCSVIAAVVVIVAVIMIFILPNSGGNTAPTNPTASTETTETQTETETEVLTEAPTEAQTEEITEAPTETPTEPPTETPTEPPTEAPTEPVTEAPTEPITETPTDEPMVEATQAIL